jgi:ABC-type branched-subunit amino acid transport system ATPase component/ABC-type branched-subunit amino acid transport system permease subunit
VSRSIYKKVGLLTSVLGLLLLPLIVSPFTVTLMNYIGIGSMIALGLVLMTGFGGLTSFGQAAFVGIGAYATAWVTVFLHLPPLFGLALALVMTGAIALLLGAITLRLGGHFLPLSTIAWGLAIYFLFPNIPGFGAHDGIRGIPPVSFGNYALASNRSVYYLIWVLLGLGMVLVSNLLDSREGRAIRSLRGGATMIASLGVDLFRIRIIIFLIAALLAGIAGWLYAHMLRFISPSPFDIRPSIEFLLMAMVGGAASVYGAVVGAAVVIFLKNWIQDLLPLLSHNAGQLEIIAFSVLLIILLQHARGGIMSIVGRFFPAEIQTPRAAQTGLVQRVLPKPGETLLEVENLQRRFGGLIAVNNVSFNVKSGEILGLIGPNGAGKSTLFNLISGALSANSGKVVFMGQDITHAEQASIAQIGIARTFQHVKLRPNMSLVDNVLLGAYTRTTSGFLKCLFRLDRNEEAHATRVALDQLHVVGLGDKATELAGNLPLGNQRVLEIARALAADPIMIILDEPAAGLRKAEKDMLAQQLREIRGRGVSILLVEHDMDFVMGLVDRIVVLDFGSKIMEGLPADVRASAVVQEAYLGGVA